MEMITFKQTGDLGRTHKFLTNARKLQYKAILSKYGKLGIRMLESNTPTDTGMTATSWNYEIVITQYTSTIYWTNSNLEDGVPVAILLQYGHGTKNGGYVSGRDYINPALQPVFDDIVNSAWKELTSL